MAGVLTQAYGSMAEGGRATLYTLTNDAGGSIGITDYGAIIVSIGVPDRRGRPADVVLGYDSLTGYFANKPYFGAVIGRYANRIDQARFMLDGEVHRLSANDGGNTLHGGLIGFDKKLWQGIAFERTDVRGVELTHRSANGDQGFPGNLEVRVIYTLLDHNELNIEYHAICDQPTVINLTQHSYFNLNPDGCADILDHEIFIAADCYTPVGATLIPTGEMAAVAGTPFDFRVPCRVGARIADDHTQLSFGQGYDHNYVLNSGRTGPAARVREPQSGRVLEMRTTEPGVQFYSGNHLDGSIAGKRGHYYARRSGLALEAQHFPDSPNQPRFPSTILRPGGRFFSRTAYLFSVE
ncbi:MAG: galactose mutarotase [Pseudomonadota bacterium]|nr:galactose mutarotase [Pseudomonadota bacterium]